jgi:DNA-binding LytR/AlgR family response regulator
MNNKLFEPQNEHTLDVKEKNQLSIVLVADILYIDCLYGVCTIHTFDRNILIIASLKDFEIILQDFGFIRVHNNAIINGRYIQRLTHYSNEKILVFIQGHPVRVSVRRLKSLKDFIAQHFDSVM